VGGDHKQIEADEAVSRKKDLPRKEVEWTEYVGAKERGNRKSLVLVKRKAADSKSKRAAPVRRGKKGRACPPPLKKEEWQKVAKKHVKDKTILRTDAAPAYVAMVPKKEIRRDTVNHGCRNGGPYFTKKVVHKKLTGQSKGKNKKATVAGTQSLDGWWGTPKRNLRGVRADHGQRVDERVRESQWLHWLGSDDPFKAAGQVLKEVRVAAVTQTSSGCRLVKKELLTP